MVIRTTNDHVYIDTLHATRTTRAAIIRALKPGDPITLYSSSFKGIMKMPRIVHKVTGSALQVVRPDSGILGFTSTHISYLYFQAGDEYFVFDADERVRRGFAVRDAEGQEVVYFYGHPEERQCPAT